MEPSAVRPPVQPAAAAGPRCVLICGVGGQDGAYLADHLLGLGYRVVGTSRDAQASSFSGLTRLGIRDRVTVESMTLVDFRSTMQAIARMQGSNLDQMFIEATDAALARAREIAAGN